MRGLAGVLVLDALLRGHALARHGFLLGERLLHADAEQTGKADTDGEGEDEAEARGAATGGRFEARAHWRALAADIAGWQRDRRLPTAQPLPAPPGDPFGEDEEF
jgi:hypothetical protein